jgi:hypothetical protein
MGYNIGSMEIKKYSEAGVDFQLEHPMDGPIVDENGKPLTINLCGADSARIKAAVRERQKKQAAEAVGKSVDVDDAARETENVEDLVTLTNGWSDNWMLDDQPFPFSKENAEKLYRRFPDIAAWATAKVTMRINFMLGWSKK